MCRYDGIRGTFSLTSQIWDDGDVHEHKQTRDSVQIAHPSPRRGTRPCCQNLSILWDRRSTFYRWRQAYAERGETGLINASPIPKWHGNRTAPEREEKVLYLRRKYHLGPMRIAWYLERYHGINVSDATVSRILRRHELNRLPRGTRMRKVHTKRYQKQVPGHHFQMDVEFLTFKGKKGEKLRRFQYTAIDDTTCVP